MPGTDTPRLFQGAFRQLNKFFVVISVNLYLTRGHYISVLENGAHYAQDAHLTLEEMVTIAKDKGLDPIAFLKEKLL